MASQKTSIVLYVESADRSVVFYEALLGAAPGQRSAAEATFDLDSPPLLLVVAEQADAGTVTGRRPSRRGRPLEDAESDHVPLPRFTLIVNEPQQVGVAAVALRRTGARLRLGDSGIAVCDPDENLWQVRWVPSAPARAVLADLQRAVRSGPAHGAQPTPRARKKPQPR